MLHSLCIWSRAQATQTVWAYRQLLLGAKAAGAQTPVIRIYHDIFNDGGATSNNRWFWNGKSWGTKPDFTQTNRDVYGISDRPNFPTLGELNNGCVSLIVRCGDVQLSRLYMEDVCSLH